MHGIKVNELTTGTRAIKAVSTAIIGLVGTAPDQLPEQKAKLLTGVVESDNAQTFTAKSLGTAGNAVTLALVDPSANSAALTVTVTGTAISVSLATDAEGEITTTAALLAAAIAGNVNANALVGVANTGVSTGLGAVSALPATALSGGRDDAFPLNALTLVTDVRGAIAQAGAGGTLGAALAAIADQTGAVVVVSRVDEDAEDQEALTQAGVEMLLGAQAAFNVKPRILGAPGLDTQGVATTLAATARKLRSMAYAMAVGEDVAEATEYRENFGARELMLLWPGFSAGGADTIARALGLRARIDLEQGWHKTLSNAAVDGVTGFAKPLFFDITGAGDEANEVNLLNVADITTMIRQDGFRFWGNRTCSDEPLFAFESTVRAAQILQDTIAAGLMWAIDKPLTKILIKDIVETVNAAFRGLINEGKLIGANAWYDPSLNSEADLAAGKLTIDYDFTPASPLEGLTLNQRITDRYYASFADLAG